MKFACLFFIVLSGCVCGSPHERTPVNTWPADSAVHPDSVRPPGPDSSKAMIDTDSPVKGMPGNIEGVTPQQLIAFGKTLIGVPYKYASTDPSVGLDCSGFITCVFSHFNVEVPRSSVEFTNYGKEVDLNNATAGDLILFTGTNDSIRVVGHMGIVTENTDTLRFIHSTSGKANGVTITSLGDYYKKRFVKVVRVFRGGINNK